MADKYQLEDGSGNYLLEDGSGAYLLEESSTVITVTTILKYELTGSGNVRERPVFNYEFPQKIYVILT